MTATGKAFAVEEQIPIHVQQVIDGSKVTDHHALLPTKSMANADLAALPAGERNILRLIAARLLCAVGEPHRYAETTLTTICAGEEFSAKGKVVLSDGWKVMERKMLGELLGKQKEAVVLPDAQEQSQCSVADAELKEGQTSPPKHFTEDLLLHAMETASADSMPEGVERQGIGTPATRAATIEKLVQKGFLERKGTKKTKVLLPTDKGKALITVMPEEIQITGNDRRLGNKAAANRTWRNGAERIYDRDQYDDYRTGKEHGNEKRSECTYEKQNHWCLSELRCKCCGA